MTMNTEWCVYVDNCETNPGKNGKGYQLCNAIDPKDGKNVCGKHSKHDTSPVGVCCNWGCHG